MEKQKKQLIGLLAVLIAALIAFVVVSRLPDEEDAQEETVTYEVTKLEAEDVTKLVYTNETETFTLTKNDDGWVCDEYRDVTIDEDAVMTMVNKVAAMTSENKIENVEDISQYGLDEPSLTILVSDSTDTYTILVGDYNATTYTYYMCLENDKTTVYTTESATISSFNNNTIEDLTAEEETTVEETTEAEETTTETETTTTEE